MTEVRAADLSVLVIPGRTFPTDHAMLETVYARILPGKGYRVAWAMHAAVPANRVTRWEQTDVHLVPGTEDDPQPPWFPRLASWVRLLVHVARLALRQPFDIIHVRNNVAPGLVALIVQRLRGGRFVFQFTFPLPEAALMGMRPGRFGLPRWPALVARVERRLRDWLLRRADLVMPISDELAAALVRKGIPADRLFTFPMCTDCPADPDPAEVQRLRETLGLGEAPVVVHIGTISPRRRLDFLIRVAALVHRTFPEARWLFVGRAHGGVDAALAAQAAAAGLGDRVVFRGWVPRAQVPAHLALASVSVSPIPPVSIYWASSPTKTVESLALGCPVVATDIPDQVRLIEASGGGLIVPFEEQAFAAAVCRLLRDPAAAVEMGRRGRAYVRAQRSYAALTARLDVRYREMCRYRGATSVAPASLAPSPAAREDGS